MQFKLSFQLKLLRWPPNNTLQTKRQKLVCREEVGVNQKMIWWKKKKLLLYLRKDLVQNRK